MTLYIDRSLDYASLPTTITLRNKSCLAESNQTHYTISTGYHECETNQTYVGDEIVYENIAKMVPQRSGLIITSKHVTTFVEMKCHFSRSITVQTKEIQVLGKSKPSLDTIQRT